MGNSARGGAFGAEPCTATEEDKATTALNFASFFMDTLLLSGCYRSRLAAFSVTGITEGDNFASGLRHSLVTR
jgi:hypothetical protein